MEYTTTVTEVEFVDIVAENEEEALAAVSDEFDEHHADYDEIISAQVVRHEAMYLAEEASCTDDKTLPLFDVEN